ncbi:hypothetical protein BKA56DRAFT_493345 [Ilyonectria sp. MPI-CAGE-AT-0026]|nr:hypothetical protein BKA56DRAFT_493345 [Ilyonectria sp. MPI-CAGE-AT-0026]
MFEGCHECCKRRLKCDKTEPECLKCLKKGIGCSGQGFRYVSTQTTPVNPQSGSRPKNVVFRFVTSQADAPSPPQLKKNQRQRGVDARDQSKSSHAHERHAFAAEMKPSVGVSDMSRKFVSRRSGFAVLHFEQNLRPALNESMNPQTRILFHHFSECIAPIMVVLDSISNGYRDIIIPLACQDECLGRAVSVVASFHLAEKIPEMRQTAEADYQTIIEKLRHDSMQLQSGQVFNPFTLATILVLLVGETITGADNYGYLLEMLACLIQSPGTIEALPPALKEFFWQQVKMFQLFGIPLTNEAKGVEIFTRPPDYYLEFMAYPELTAESEHYNNVNLIRAAILDAGRIYRRRVESSLHQYESIHLVEQLRQNVLGLGMHVKGVHALVWTYFIGAAESILPEHREFFTERLNDLYDYTGFGSIPAGLEALRTVWAKQAFRRWTDVVINDTPILVM